jgi:hypothetical protein
LAPEQDTVDLVSFRWQIPKFFAARQSNKHASVRNPKSFAARLNKTTVLVRNSKNSLSAEQRCILFSRAAKSFGCVSENFRNCEQALGTREQRRARSRKTDSRRERERKM